jgi:choline-sulfatase
MENLVTVLLNALVLAAAVATPAPPSRLSLVLVTLDTFRADHVGIERDGRPLTPTLDELTRRGMRFTRALAPAPLTLPAHCSLMTGLNPPDHGVRDNGASSLPEDVPTLASVLARRGFATAAFVGSRVLDHRFGLARGFELYDDRMTAEEVGEQGYPERRASVVTDAALAWAAQRRLEQPFFLWVHYYDAHAPYDPPHRAPGASAAGRYAGEVSYVDAELGRLLRGLSTGSGRLVIAAVGDHGEMLGEHGEKEHGIFLYRAALEVPLILSGAGVPAGTAIERPVGTRALPATLITLLGLAADAAAFGPGLPDLAGAPQLARDALVYSETWLPGTAYGWSPLQSVTQGALRLIRAPRPELYDLSADPTESTNLFTKRPEDARRLGALLAESGRSTRAAPPPSGTEAERAELSASLRSLGYLSGATGRAGSTDPKDGIALLDGFDRAREELRAGRASAAAARLRELNRMSPGNVPFLIRLAEAEVGAGQTEAGLAAARDAIALNPALDLLHTSAAGLYARVGRFDRASAEYEIALELNPRSAPAWLGLAELASRRDTRDAERAILLRAEEAGTDSAAILARLAQLELSEGRLEDAQRHSDASIRLLPSFAQGWWVAGEVAERRGAATRALESYARAIELGVTDARALVRLGRLQRQAGREQEARRSLRRAAELGGETAVGRDARRLLGESR